ncbi:family 1 glycosylhydrolase [Sphingopyxis sp.]|uniref:family 1 glycosylhydrolase n=1 Tax=Sphingopyxis sp. TaxID=1908224 RepID=UPI0039C9A6ED
MELNRRTLIGAGAALAATLPLGEAMAKGRRGARFPKGFLWGAATAGHQIEGNNVNSDIWLAENVKPTFFAEPSGDAANSFALWPQDLDLVKAMGLNSYRFSIEWARIEPEPGMFSIAMLDHYKAMIEGCAKRGLVSMVTFSHWSTPRWFAARGGWANPEAPDLFANFCDKAARHLAAGIGYAVTLNEPNLLVGSFEAPRPERVQQLLAATMAAAAKASGSDRFAMGLIGIKDLGQYTEHLIAAHKKGKAAIKAVRGALPVGVTMAIPDDQEAGPGSLRDRFRQEVYVPWLEVARADDFLGVQNYDRQLWDAKGKAKPPEGDSRSTDDALVYNASGGIVYPDSLANSVRYAYSLAKVPIFVTEHGVNTADDRIRANLIPAALGELKKAMDEGIPVMGYLHWSLLDNFEWVSGYKHQYGLIAVDRSNFKRTPKPSASVLAAIARANALPAG